MGDCARQAVKLGLALAAFLLGSGPAAAHPALYHYLEINLHQPGEVRVYVTLHAPELSPDVAPLEEDVFGAEWLSGLDDDTIAGLVAEADRFVDRVFAFTVGGQPVAIDPVFPDAESIRHPGADSDVPAGCFSGVAELFYASADSQFQIDFSVDAEKRLMLVINRPGEFPEVFDIEPGQSRAIALPPAPVPVPPPVASGPDHQSLGMRLMAIAGAIVGATLVVFWLVAVIRSSRA